MRGLARPPGVLSQHGFGLDHLRRRCPDRPEQHAQPRPQGAGEDEPADDDDSDPGRAAGADLAVVPERPVHADATTAPTPEASVVDVDADHTVLASTAGDAGWQDASRDRPGFPARQLGNLSPRRRRNVSAGQLTHLPRWRLAHLSAWRLADLSARQLCDLPAWRLRHVPP